MQLKLLNIGCGATYHPAWINIDAEPVSREISRHNVVAPLPFDDSTFDVCYCSHLLEHLSRHEGRQLLGEMHRILKPAGILRVVVPDLEAIVRSYLTVMEQALASTNEFDRIYEWTLLELLDQMTRDTSGGNMELFLKNCPPDLQEFISGRIGNEARRFWKNETESSTVLSKLAAASPGWVVNKIRFLILSGLAWLVAGTRGTRSVKEGWFRTSGEVHRWMYDRYSLGVLLCESEFRDVAVCAPNKSRISGFDAYGLDVIDGVVRKPDSLFMEGVRP